MCLQSLEMDSLQAVSRQGYGSEDQPSPPSPPPEPSTAAAADPVATSELEPPPQETELEPSSVADPSPPASPPVAANPGATSELETPSEAVSDDDNSEEEEPREDSPKRQKTSPNEDCEQEPKSPDSAPSAAPGDLPNEPNQSLKASTSKKKKKSSNIWVSKTVNRKGKKKGKSGNGGGHAAAVAPEDIMPIVPAPRLFPDKNDDNAEMQICLSRVYKAEKVEVSDDRMSAMSSKGYRMIRATRGILQGAWYFEIKVVRLGETGHTRLGWSTEKGDLQAPVGYDANSYGYRDIDGSKIHKALREKYAEEGYKEGDVIGFYINLPDGELYAPKPPVLVLYKGKRYMSAPDNKDDQPKVIPGSEISFFKNGVCQGVAYTDLLGGRYYPAASMYTMPNQPDCEVRFNFGPNFEFFPADFDGRPIPLPMVEAPYHGVDSGVENAAPQEILLKKSSTRMIEA